MARNLLLAVSATLAPCVLWAGQGSGGPLHEFVLENGMEVLVVENHSVPLATVVVAVRGGAWIQTKGTEGLPHLFEHLVFRQEVHQAAARLHGIANGATEFDVVYYDLVLPSANAFRGIELLADVIIDADFSEADLTAERTVVLDELEREQADPEGVLQRNVMQRLWGPDWYRRDIAGDRFSLMRITRDQLTKGYDRYYVPNNTALIVTGDVEPDEVLRAAERHFGRWQRGPDPVDWDRPALFPLRKMQAWTLAHPVADVTMYLAMRGPGTLDDAAGTHAADALFEILNDAASSFQKELVRSGLFAGLAIEHTTLRDGGIISVIGKTTDAKAVAALRAVLVVLDSIDFLADVTEDDLARARKRRQVNTAVAWDGAAHLATVVARWWAVAGMGYFTSYGESAKRQTVADLRHFANAYLVRQPKVIGLMGHPETMTRISEWLKGVARKPDGGP